jgi:hypothetical protein
LIISSSISNGTLSEAHKIQGILVSQTWGESLRIDTRNSPILCLDWSEYSLILNGLVIICRSNRWDDRIFEIEGKSVTLFTECEVLMAVNHSIQNDYSQFFHPVLDFISAFCLLIWFTHLNSISKYLFNWSDVLPSVSKQ